MKGLLLKDVYQMWYYTRVIILAAVVSKFFHIRGIWNFIQRSIFVCFYNLIIDSTKLTLLMGIITRYLRSAISA